MKKLTVLFITAIWMLTLAGCTAIEPPEATAQATEPPTRLHTVAPTLAKAEPEWTALDCDIALTDGDTEYIGATDFLYVALVTEDEEITLQFMLSDLAAEALSAQGADSDYVITLDGESIGRALLSDDFTILTLVGDHTYEEIEILANQIRGFE